MLNEYRDILVSGSRTRQREATRRELVQAGLKVVAARGFAGATTAAIAEASGKAHGTVFVHFRTRDALVAELVEEIGRAMSQRLADIPNDHARPERSARCAPGGPRRA